MKRLAILLCVLALLLAGCTRPSGPETPPVTTEQGTAAATEPARTSTEAPTEAPGTEPLQTEPGESWSEGSRTENGVLVWTDPSAYQPYGGAEAKYTRLREGPLDAFEPSEDYGAVYPYAAARLFASQEGGQSWEAGLLYGLADASGRILTDGIYSNVSPVTNRDYVREETRYLPFWVVEAVGPVEIVSEELGEESYSYLDGETRYGVVSMDGSFALPVEYRMVSALGEGFLCQREWDGVSYEVYDGSGQLLFTGAELLGEDDHPFVTVVDGGEGFYLIELYGDGRESACWFCDSRGNRVLGPYLEAEPFSEGLACVSLDGEGYGYIDESGAWVIQPWLSSRGSFLNGRAIHSDEDLSSTVIDRDGNLIFSRGSGFWLRSAPCGFRAVDGNSGGAAYYDRDGNFLIGGDYELESLDEDTFLEELDDEHKRIFRLNGPELTVPWIYVYPGVTVVDGEVAAGYLGYVCSEEDGYVYHPCFVSGDLSLFRRLDAEGQAPPNLYSSCYSTVDQCTNEEWCLCWNGSAWTAVNEAGEIRSIPFPVSYPKLWGDRFMVVTDRACIHADWEGNILFCYPLDAQD